MIRRLGLMAAVTLAPVAMAEEPAAPAAGLGLTLEEFKMYRQYTNALEDSRVQKMKPEARLGAIAKNAGFKPKELQKAIDKGEAAGDFKRGCDDAVKAALDGAGFTGKVGKVDMDLSAPNAVGYVQWNNEDLAQLEEEASLLAAHTARACPLISDIQVWATDKSQGDKRVFQALISGANAAQIDPAKTKDFADTRYIRKFEKVKSAAKGDDLSEPDAGK